MRRLAVLGSLSLLAGLLTVLTAGAGSPAPAAAAAAADLPYTKEAILIRVGVGPDNDIGCVIKADKYRPKRVGRNNPGPAILTTNGFGGEKDDAGQAAAASAFAGAGYVVISYSGLGFGGSSCKITLDDPDYDGKAGKQVLDVLAGTRPYTLDDGSGRKARIPYVSKERVNGRATGDPKVGMVGGSYGGQVQFAVAQQDPRLDAIIPQITWNDLSYSLAPNNTDTTRGVTYATPGVAKKQWINLFFGLGIASGLEYAQADPTRNLACPNFRAEACPAIAQLNTAGYPDQTTLDLARHASVSTYLDKITIPTLLVQGQRDTLFNLQEAVATYRALKDQGTEARMVWFSGGHSGPNAAGDFDLSEGITATHLGRRYLAWMDRYVRGIRTSTAGPQFEYFRDWVDYDETPGTAGTAVDRAYARSSATYTGAPTDTLYLTGEDALTDDAAAVQPGSADFVAGPGGTSYSETSGVEGQQVDNDVSDTPGTFASWTTPELSRDAVLVGSPKLTVSLASPTAEVSQGSGPAGQLVLFAKLYDVAPDGTETLQHRLVSPVRVGDVTEPVTIELPGVAQQFPAGHRIRLVLAGGDAAYAGNDTPQAVSVETSPQAPGTLELPLTTALELTPNS